jgi:hypothetical protein
MHLHMGHERAGVPSAGPRAAAIGLAAVLLAGGALAFFRIPDPDVFWHLRTGQVILETGRLVRTNLFSSTWPDYPWHNMEWLFEVLLALAYRASGWAGVAAFKIGCALAAAAILYRTLLERRPRPFLASAVTIWLLALLRFRLTERPHIVTFVLFAATIWAVERRARGGRELWALPPLFALWSNCHPELTLALAYLAATVAGDWLDSARGRPLPAGAIRREVLVLLACAAATLLNPEGWRVILSPVAMAREVSPVLAIWEFRRSTPAGNPLFFAQLAAVAALALLRRDLRSFSTLLPLAALGAVGVLYVRGTTAFAMASAPALYAGLAGLAPPASPALRRRLLEALVAAAAAAAVCWAVLLDRGLTYRWGYGPDDELFPAAAASFILANDLPPNLYNGYTLGGYLIWRLHPRMGVFVDGRGPYPPEFYRAATGSHDGAALRRLYDDYRVNTALVGSTEAAMLFPAGEWGVVFWDTGYAVLVRRTPANAALLARLEYRALLPGRPLPRDRTGLLQAVAEARRNQAERLRPDWSVALSAGIAQLRLWDLPAAEREMARAAELAPREPEPWAYLSVLRSMLGRPAEAAAAAEKARALDPGQKVVGGILGAARP